MLRTSLPPLAALLVFAAASCNCGGGAANPDASIVTGSCDIPGVDPKCGSACTGDTDCPATLYCLSKKCVADCVGVGTACNSGGTCAERGRCLLAAPDGGTPVPDAGECARVSVTATLLVPTVQLLIDRSGSMAETFSGGTSRWDALKAALVGVPDGVVTKLQSKVRFGATLYTNDRSGTCPNLDAIDPRMDNAPDIKKLLDGNSPSQDTPTGESLDATAQKLHDTTPIEGGDGPRIVVLCTDGEPDTCANPDPKDVVEQKEARDVSLAAARKAFQQLGIATYVLSVGTDTAQSHLQDMANAGTGTPSGNDAPYYVASDPAGMVSGLETILKGVRNCRFTLSGSVVPGMEDTGQVALDGKALTKDAPDGWKLVDAKTLELTGAACTAYQQEDQPTVEASFGCGGIIN